MGGALLYGRGGERNAWIGRFAGYITAIAVELRTRTVRGIGETSLLTRGYLIGQIVDDLADIASQARQRARLGFTDLHVYVENFAREVLNRMLGLNLRNLNEEMNTSGLDLADDARGWAFQVMGDKTLEKVKATLLAIRPEDRAKYAEIRMLVIGDKQGSYSLTG